MDRNMNSNTKFRLWEKSTNYLPGNVGTMHHPDALSTDYMLTFDGRIMEKFVDTFGGESFDNYRDVTDDFVLMQYTGLKDKNGVEIFEGDIFLTNPQTDYTATKTVVKFSKGCFLLTDIATQKRNLATLYEFDGEVIGNIYDNPELINA